MRSVLARANAQSNGGGEQQQEEERGVFEPGQNAVTVVSSILDSVPALKELDDPLTLTAAPSRPQGIQAWQQRGQAQQGEGGQQGEQGGQQGEEEGARGGQVSEDTLERWRRAYSVLATDARGKS